MMNQVIKTSRVSGKTARAASAIISSQGDILYSGASFNPLIIYDTDRNEFTEIDSPGVPLGADMDTRYQLTTGRLRDKSIGLMFSKGLLSACNKEGEFFTIEMVKDVIVQYSRETPAVITREIYEKFRSFTGSRNQLEDVSIIIFKKVKSDG
jgi:sigma-B regulation protein RsbU (phosphoserine phosphatase)